MDTREVGSMRLAAVALLFFSVFRWGLTLDNGGAGDGRGELLQALSVEEAVAVEKAARARRPLDDGERLDPNRADVDRAGSIAWRGIGHRPGDRGGSGCWRRFSYR